MHLHLDPTCTKCGTSGMEGSWTCWTGMLRRSSQVRGNGHQTRPGRMRFVPAKSAENPTPQEMAREQRGLDGTSGHISRSACSKEYRRKRNEYFRTQRSENISNPRQMWSVINQVTEQSRQQQEPACPMDAVSTAFHKVITDTSRPQSLQIQYQADHPHSNVSSPSRWLLSEKLSGYYDQSTRLRPQEVTAYPVLY